MIVESVDLCEEHDDRIRITEWEIRILEYLTKKLRKMLGTRESIESLDVEIGSVLVRELGIKESRPGIWRIISTKKARLISELAAHTILIIHELVDESIGDLIDLTFWIGDLSDEDISTGVDTILGSGVEHKNLISGKNEIQ